MKIIFHFAEGGGFVAFDLSQIQLILHLTPDNVISVLMKGASYPNNYNFGTREETARNAKILLDAWSEFSDSMTIKPVPIKPVNPVEH